jgi:hypothetical protein
MKIHWVRIVVAGLVAELGLLVIYDLLIRLHLDSTVARLLVVIAGSFVFVLLGALWAARKSDAYFVLQGTLVGVAAVVVYILMTLPMVLRGHYPMNYWLAALVGHPPKLLGGVAGGFLAGRRLNAKKSIAQKAAKSAT